METTKKLTVPQEIAHRNKIFEAANPAEKRVLIAEDVIEQVKAEKIIGGRGNWVAIREILREDKSLRDLEPNSLQTEFIKGGIKCTCCGVGSLMLSCILFKNKVTVEEALNQDIDYGNVYDNIEDRAGVEQVFDRKQLVLIELAFEMGGGYFKRYDLEEPERYDQVVKFGDQYCGSRERLIAIMNNIIDNKGEFIP